MANTMTTYVKVSNLNPETHKKFTEIFSVTEDDSFVNILDNLTKMFGVNPNESKITREWMIENTGSKSLEIQVFNDSMDGKFSEDINLIINSAWNVPTKYIQKLVEILNAIDKNVVAYGTYEDESYSPVGAFVYGYDYDDIEDYDEFDNEQMFDDDYLENFYEELYSHRDSLYEGYLEVKKEREEYEQL